MVLVRLDDGGSWTSFQRKRTRGQSHASVAATNTCFSCPRCAHGVSSLFSFLNRVPTFLGSIENVFELDQFYQYYGGDESEKKKKDELEKNKKDESEKNKKDESEKNKKDEAEQ